MNFECHVTVNAPSGMPTLEALALRNGWKTSTIDGDPVLGKGPRFYFTRHGNSFPTLHQEMIQLSDELVLTGAPVIRRKIEAILVDDRIR